MAEEFIPLARPVLGEEEERAVIEVLRSGQLSLGPKVRGVRAVVRGARGGGPGKRGVQRDGGASPCATRGRCGRGRRGDHQPVLVRRVGECDRVLRRTPVFADIDPVTLNLDPAAAEAAITPRTKAILPVHIFGYPADMPAFERIAQKHGLAIVEDACEALGARHADGTAVGGRGNLAVFGFYANKQITTGEGGMVTMGDAGVKAGIDSERNQGRAPDMDWLDHDRLGFNYRLSDIACALGIAQLGRLDEMLAGRARVAEMYREALGGIEGLQLPCPDQDGNVRGWFVFVVQLPRGVDRDEVVRALGEAGIQSKPYLPAIHLMSFYRERFGGREGMFPVCEGVAGRSVALPFFTQMRDGQIGRIAELLRNAPAKRLTRFQ